MNLPVHVCRTSVEIPPQSKPGVVPVRATQTCSPQDAAQVGCFVGEYRVHDFNLDPSPFLTLVANLSMSPGVTGDVTPSRVSQLVITEFSAFCHTPLATVLQQEPILETTLIQNGERTEDAAAVWLSYEPSLAVSHPIRLSLNRHLEPLVHGLSVDPRGPRGSVYEVTAWLSSGDAFSIERATYDARATHDADCMHRGSTSDELEELGNGATGHEFSAVLTLGLLGLLGYLAVSTELWRTV